MKVLELLTELEGKYPAIFVKGFGQSRRNNGNHR